MLSNDSGPDHDHVAGAPVPAAAWLVPYGLGWCVFLVIELALTSKAASRRMDWESLLAADTDSLIVLGFLLAAPIFWWLGRRPILGRASLSRWLSRSLGQPAGNLCGPAYDLLRPICFSIVVAGISLIASKTVASRFDNLPPVYHDEFSYLFQAETFLAGRVSFPSHAGARLFDQMHVLNEGRFASRYFPGTGLWMAPFVSVGHPYWGHWLAGAICAALTFWIGRELAGDSAGLIAGLLTALSPAMALFSNLLLAHHPTLVGLGVFILGVLRMLRLASVAWGFTAGMGLTFALLCRPMTAASVALPFGVYIVWWACLADVRWRRRSEDAGQGPGPTSPPLPGRKRRLWASVAMGVPLVAGGIGLFFYDRAITGSGWVTPYELYTDIYTPRHVYGFNNVIRGEQHLGPRVIANYDKWADNLTPALALGNAVTRLSASWKWTLGILPLTLALGSGFVLWRRLPRGAWLILAAIVSLHAAHIPYWFVGIEQHHYVFEGGRCGRSGRPSFRSKRFAPGARLVEPGWPGGGALSWPARL